MNLKDIHVSRKQRKFIFLLGYRWASLLPVLWLLFYGEDIPQFGMLSSELVFGLAATLTLLITITYKRLNKLAIKNPWFFGVDLMLSSAIIAISGGIHSPYYLYALSPLLASAFFFYIPGALYSSLLFTPLYVISVNLSIQESLTTISAIDLFTKIVGIWLVPPLVGNFTSIVKKLRTTQDELKKQNEKLARSHRQLNIIHDLATIIQAAPDIQSVTQRVLEGITKGLGYTRAATVLVDPVSEHLGNWNVLPALPLPEDELPALGLNPHDGLLLKSMYQSAPAWLPATSKFTGNKAVNAWMQQTDWIVLPLNMQNHMVGLLLVESEQDLDEIKQTDLEVLESVAKQVAVSLGTTLLCIDRARNLATEQERNRIARDIHDTVSQSLFGMVFSLDACIDQLPKIPTKVKDELLGIRSLASSTRDEIRHSILDTWPSQLNMKRFKADLRSYTSHCCKPNNFSINFSTEGDIVHLPSGIRRSLYRVAQEALSNASRHSGASQADVCLYVDENNIYMSIKDKGKGFDTETILARQYNRESFGIHGIKERIRAIGGHVDIIASEGHGTQLLFDINLNNG